MLIFFCIFEMLKYILSESLFLGKINKKHRIYLVGIFAYACFAFFVNVSAGEKNIAACAVALVCFFLTIEGDWKSRFINSLILFFITVSVSGISQFLYDVFFSCLFNDESKVLQYLIKDFTSVLLICLGLITKMLMKKSTRQKLKLFIEGNMNFGTIFAALIITFSLSLLEISKEMIPDQKYRNMVVAVSGIAYVSIGFLGGMTLYIKRMNDEMKELMKNEVMLNDIQKKYYEALLDKEKETRAYRHDISNHLICLSALAEEGKTEAIVTYLDDMQGEIRRIKGKTYNTGNEILDIMTNFYLPQLSDKIKIEVRASAEIDIDDRKICTIYSNLLQNAVEELNSNPQKEGELNILFKKQNGIFSMMISNSIFREKKNGEYKTQKEDKKNHGIGLSNVKTAVEDLGGKIYINSDDGMFKVIVEIKDV